MPFSISGLRQYPEKWIGLLMPTASLSADGPMNSAEFHILRRNEDLYASKREPCSFSCGHYTKNSATVSILLYQ